MMQARQNAAGKLAVGGQAHRNGGQAHHKTAGEPTTKRAGKSEIRYEKAGPKLAQWST
jgi:hypothetical protein